MFSSLSKNFNFNTHIFVDYMQLPPENERVWRHHPLLIDFEHNFEELTE